MKTRTKRQISTAVATFGVALGIGFVMQYGDAIAGLGGADAPVTGPGQRLSAGEEAIPVQVNMAVPVTLATPTPRLQAPATPAGLGSVASELDEVAPPGIMTPPSATDPAEIASAPAPDAAVQAPEIASVEEPAPVVAPQDDILESAPTCETRMTLSEADLAMVTVNLSNPCRVNTVVLLSHEGLLFHEITDDAGNLTLDLPVLSEEAYVIAAYDDGEGAVAMTGVASLPMYDRVALQWQGQGSFQLHALEYGASYGEAGHVWAEAPAGRTQAMDGKGGFLISLGNPDVPEALQAEVYTFPSAMALESGEVAISVEAEVTAATCGRGLNAQGLKAGGDGPIELTLTLPGCDSTGEFLVLKNVFEDLTLAAR